MPFYCNFTMVSYKEGNMVEVEKAKSLSANCFLSAIIATLFLDVYTGELIYFKFLSWIFFQIWGVGNFSREFSGVVNISRPKSDLYKKHLCEILKCYVVNIKKNFKSWKLFKS